MPETLATDLTAARPFLIKPDVSGTKLEPNTHAIEDNPNFLYQATNFRNLQTIKTDGLDPNKGGQGGAGAAVGVKHFINNSRGKVHGTSSSATASSYALMKDDPSLYVRVYKNIGDLDKKSAPQDLGDFAIILRFSRNIPGVRWELDPDDKRKAYRTDQVIPSSVIEGLTTEGWKPIVELTELDKALKGS